MSTNIRNNIIAGSRFCCSSYTIWNSHLTISTKRNWFLINGFSELDFEINLRLALTLRLIFTSLLTILFFFLSILFNMPIIVGESCSVLMISTWSLCLLYIESFNVAFIVNICCVGLPQSVKKFFILYIFR